MSDRSAALLGLAALIASTLVGCGQTGELYLPEPASEVVTKPADSPPSENTQAPNSPQTPDSPPTPPSPTPEVTEPEEKKDKGAAPPVPK
jgi:predicted small lipoprotein YifL